MAGLLGALLLLLGVVVGFVVLRDANRVEPSNPVPAVEWRQPTSYARQEAEFQLLAPRRLPEGWRVTSVRFGQGDDQSWHLGLLTGEGRYIGLEQAADSPSTMVEDFVDAEAQQGEDVDIDGESWQAWSDDEDEALVREGPEVTTLVVGTGSQDQLVEFVRLLR